MSSNRKSTGTRPLNTVTQLGCQRGRPQVPGWQEIRKLALDLHEKPAMHLVGGWDAAITDSIGCLDKSSPVGSRFHFGQHSRQKQAPSQPFPGCFPQSAFARSFQAAGKGYDSGKLFSGVPM